MSEIRKIILDYYKDKGMDINDIIQELDNLKIDLIYDYLDHQDKDSIYVIKRTGTIEKYNQEKILRSIRSAAEENGQYLNNSDLDILIDDVTNQLESMDRRVFKTEEIKEIVKKALKDEGFSQIYDSYVSYIKI